MAGGGCREWWNAYTAVYPSRVHAMSFLENKEVLMFTGVVVSCVPARTELFASKSHPRTNHAATKRKYNVVRFTQQRCVQNSKGKVCGR